MKVKLMKFVFGRWYCYASYDLELDSDLQAYTEACAELGKYYPVKAVKEMKGGQ